MAVVKILLVEDESIVAMDMERRLSTIGYSVIEHVMTGKQAIKRALDLRPDLILMDIHLKGDVDGIEAAEKILESTAIPVIYITAYSDEKTLARAKVTQPFGYILKPFQEREIHSTIEMALYKHKIEQELRRAKKAAEVGNRTKSEFLANVSHELRTPLNSILGMTQLAIDCEDAGERQEYLEIVMKSGKNLLMLIDSILDFSRMESGKISMGRGDFFLDRTVEAAVENLWPEFLRKKLRLYLELVEDSRFHLIGDEYKVRQIFDNLVKNAVKFTEEGFIRVRVRTEKKSEKEVRILGVVEDTGCGIPAKDLDTVFSAFHQLDASSTREYSGTGLGLSIVKQLVELMNGHIEVQSEVGKGSRFSFELQCETVSADTGTKSQDTQDGAGKLPESIRKEASVFLISQDPDAGDIRKGAFESLGIRVIRFSEKLPENGTKITLPKRFLFLVEGDSSFVEEASRRLIEAGIQEEYLILIFTNIVRMKKNNSPISRFGYPVERRALYEVSMKILGNKKNRSPATSVDLAPIGEFLRKYAVEGQSHGGRTQNRECLEDFLRDISGGKIEDMLGVIERRAQSLREGGSAQLSKEADKQLLRLILATRKRDLEKISETLHALSKLVST